MIGWSGLIWVLLPYTAKGAFSVSTSDVGFFHHPSGVSLNLHSRSLLDTCFLVNSLKGRVLGTACRRRNQTFSGFLCYQIWQLAGKTAPATRYVEESCLLYLRKAYVEFSMGGVTVSALYDFNHIRPIPYHLSSINVGEFSVLILRGKSHAVNYLNRQQKYRKINFSIFRMLPFRRDLIWLL